ncbi:ATP-dependent Clp protease proteolytic subunit [Cardinium endosymbiont of Culicoides punctatus]|uniref:ATP-dependent Clp protease proteolytic subunit n=1 Tax=Cardinium endosymbiont of Culicoides punctatus TaxID=2304601 RepID=UPI0014048BB8|nr:ATP-dependent Clp protease proteolytic subunit [Cardinium endosymbiont of Culicoides punctatus]
MAKKIEDNNETSSNVSTSNGINNNDVDMRAELEAENALRRARLEKQLSGIVDKIERLRLEREHARLLKDVEDEKVREEHDKAMRLLHMEKERLVVEMELEQVKFTKQMKVHHVQIAELEMKANLERSHTQLLQEQRNRLQAEIHALQTAVDREKYTHKKPVYLKEPLRKADNILVVSDRCIPLNGSIMPWSANHIVDQIQYFNNKDSSSPIFIIIGASPGGSVEAGYHILQAMHASKAPIYVVVKQYAGSMAAIIATLATKSYACPDAEILHHHPSMNYFFDSRNLPVLEEDCKMLKEIWERLGGKIAKKMGISLKEFSKKLYEKSVTGDWREYADGAKKLKWVDYVIHGIEDTGINALPNPDNYTWKKYFEDCYGFDASSNAPLSAEITAYYASAPHDFDYSYRPSQSKQNQQAQVVSKLNH